MTAADLLVKLPRTGHQPAIYAAVCELIDKHNALVRHAFATANEPVNPVIDPETRRTNDLLCAKCGKPMGSALRRWLHTDGKEYHYDCRPDVVVTADLNSKPFVASNPEVPAAVFAARLREQNQDCRCVVPKRGTQPGFEKTCAVCCKIILPEEEKD